MLLGLRNAQCDLFMHDHAMRTSTSIRTASVSKAFKTQFKIGFFHVLETRSPNVNVLSPLMLVFGRIALAMPQPVFVKLQNLTLLSQKD